MRRHYRAARRANSAADRARHTHAITRHAVTAPAVLRARRIGAYAAADGEVDLHALLGRLASRGRLIALPVIGARGRDPRCMDFYRDQPGDAGIRNRYGIREPTPGAAFIDSRALDLVFVPLVAFDAAGHRLGMGAGFYDRHFGAIVAGLRPRLVGVAFEAQRMAELPAEPWDVTLDAVLTEAGWQPVA
jgi:5-formyltetrahydrofolate cyclo-ligase